MSTPAPESIDPQGYTIAHLFSALPSFALSVLFLVTWIAPAAFGDKMISYLMLVMLMEFINVHAAGFMGNAIISDADRTRKATMIIGLGLFYTLFVGAFAFAFKQWWPLGACDQPASWCPPWEGPDRTGESYVTDLLGDRGVLLCHAGFCYRDSSDAGIRSHAGDDRTPGIHDGRIVDR